MLNGRTTHITASIDRSEHSWYTASSAREGWSQFFLATGAPAEYPTRQGFFQFGGGLFLIVNDPPEINPIMLKDALC
ncbi:hypothetical protein ACFL0Q_08875 [Thermodesulfobacteriota bacterium]